MKKKESIDENVADAHFFFGKRETHITKGLFTGSVDFGMFIIEYKNSKALLTLVFINEKRTESYVIEDPEDLLRDTCINPPDISVKNTWLRTHSTTLPKFQLDSAD